MKSYEHIKCTIERNQLELPIIGEDDQSWDTIIITEGYSDVMVLYEEKKLHYYRVLYQKMKKAETYYEDGQVYIEYFE